MSVARTDTGTPSFRHRSIARWTSAQLPSASEGVLLLRRREVDGDLDVVESHQVLVGKSHQAVAVGGQTESDALVAQVLDDRYELRVQRVLARAEARGADWEARADELHLAQREVADAVHVAIAVSAVQIAVVGRSYANRELAYAHGELVRGETPITTAHAPFPFPSSPSRRTRMRVSVTSRASALWPRPEPRPAGPSPGLASTSKSLTSIASVLSGRATPRLT